MKYWNIIGVAVLFIMLSGCSQRYNYNAVLPETPQNLTQVNTEFDDYNMVDAEAIYTNEFIFSSNRNSQGKNFDIVDVEIQYNFNQTNGNKSIGIDDLSNTNQNYYRIPRLLPLINSNYNEFGPYHYTQKIENSNSNKEVLLYANDSSGHFDLKFAYTLVSSSSEPDICRKSGYIANLLNSSSDDLYPSIDAENGIIYFCSNRNGKFHIYQVKYDKSKDITEVLQTNDSTATLVPNVNSDYNDKCPFVKGDIMVFTSDRSGGEGGLDLYYSKKEKGIWSRPVNFGSSINSPKDEYRPVFDKAFGFQNDILFFSSNREGGKGGFDLYYVGIKIQS